MAAEISRNSNSEKEKRDKIYNAIKLRISIIDIVFNFVLIAIFAFSGISVLIVDGIEQYFSNPYAIFIVFLCTIGLVYSIVGLPLDFYSSYIVEHRFNLSNQTVVKWLVEKSKSFLVGLAIGLPVSLIFYFILRKSGNIWWVYFSLFLIFFTVLLARLAPLIIFPLFYRFTKLDSGEIRDRIQNLLVKENIPIKGIYSFNMSKDTKKANAGFSGIGRSKRIILSDTLLNNFSPDEIEVIFAHEMGHYKKRHILKNILISSFIIFFSLFICNLLYDITIDVMGFDTIYSVAALPVLFFFLSVFSFIIMPVINMISRLYEREADRYALVITRNFKAFISMMKKLADINLADRNPHPVKEFIFFSHPSINRRMEFCDTVMNELKVK